MRSKFTLSVEKLKTLISVRLDNTATRGKHTDVRSGI